MLSSNFFWIIETEIQSFFHVVPSSRAFYPLNATLHTQSLSNTLFPAILQHLGWLTSTVLYSLMCPSHLTTAQKLLLVNHARSVRLVWGTNCDQHLLNETLRSCYWATGGVPCIDSNARWAAKIITTFLEEPFLHVMRADYISSIKPISCRAFLRPAQHWDAHGTRNSLMSVFKGSW